MIFTLTRDELIHIRNVLEEHDGSLDHDAFVIAMQEVLHNRGAEVPERELSLLFMNIDANSGGDVNWEELTSYFLLTEVLEDRVVEDVGQSIFVDPGTLSHRTAVPPATSVRHKDKVTQVLYCKLCNAFVTASSDGMVKAWNAFSLHHLKTIFVGETNDVQYVQKLPNNVLAVATAQRYIHFYDIRKRFAHLRSIFLNPSAFPMNIEKIALTPFVTAATLAERDRTGPVSIMSTFLTHLVRAKQVPVKYFYTDKLCFPTAMVWANETLTIGTNLGDVYMFLFSATAPSANQNAVRSFHDHSASVTAILDLPAVDCIVTASDDSTVRVISRSYYQTIQVLTVHGCGISHLVWNDVAQEMVTISRDGAVFVWNPPSGKYQWNLCEGLTSQSVRDALYIPQTRFLMILRQKGRTDIWDMSARTLVQTLLIDTKIEIPTCFVFVERMMTLVFASRSGSHVLRVFTGIAGESKGPLLENITKKSTSEIQPILKIIYAAKVDVLIIAEPNKINVYDLVSRRERSSLQIEGLTAVALDHEDQKLMIGTFNDDVNLYNYITMNEVQKCVITRTQGEISALLSCRQEVPRLMDVTITAKNCIVSVFYCQEEKDVLDEPMREYDVQMLRNVHTLHFVAPALLFIFGDTGVCMANLEEASTRIIYTTLVEPDVIPPFDCQFSLVPGYVSDHSPRGTSNQTPPLVTSATDNKTDHTKRTIECVAHVPRLKTVYICGTSDGALLSYDYRQRKVQSAMWIVLSDRDSITSICVDAKDGGSYCVVGDSLGYIHFFDISHVTSAENFSRASRKVWVKRANHTSVTQVTFCNSDCTTICASGSDGRITFWETRSEMGEESGGTLLNVLSFSPLVDTSTVVDHAKDCSVILDAVRVEWLMKYCVEELPPNVTLCLQEFIEQCLVQDAPSILFEKGTYTDSSCEILLKRLLPSVATSASGKIHLGDACETITHYVPQVSQPTSTTHGVRRASCVLGPDFSPHDEHLDVRTRSNLSKNPRSRTNSKDHHSAAHAHHTPVQIPFLSQNIPHFPFDHSSPLTAYNLNRNSARSSVAETVSSYYGCDDDFKAPNPHRVFWDQSPRPQTKHATSQYNMDNVLRGFVTAPSPDLETQLRPMGPPSDQGNVRTVYTRTHLFKGVKYHKTPHVPSSPLMKKIQKLKPYKVEHGLNSDSWRPMDLKEDAGNSWCGGDDDTMRTPNKPVGITPASPTPPRRSFAQSDPPSKHFWESPQQSTGDYLNKRRVQAEHRNELHRLQKDADYTLRKLMRSQSRATNVSTPRDYSATISPTPIQLTKCPTPRPAPPTPSRVASAIDDIFDRRERQQFAPEKGVFGRIQLEVVDESFGGGNMSSKMRGKSKK